MTNNIYPPDHLLRKWESLIIDEEQNVDVVLYEAFQAGADQELEACCEWLNYEDRGFWGCKLRAARRPRPPSLREQALRELQMLYDTNNVSLAHLDTIRRALESLPD
jgi:hypothetical protein